MTGGLGTEFLMTSPVGMNIQSDEVHHFSGLKPPTSKPMAGIYYMNHAFKY